MKSFFFLLSLCILCMAEVQVITDSEFDDLEGAWFIEFYAPWCGHCKQLLPEVEKVAYTIDSLLKEGEQPWVNIGKMDCTEQTITCNAQEVKSYPTIKMFLPGKDPLPYQGERTAAAILKFLKQTMSQPEVQPLETVEAAKLFVSMSEITCIGYLTEESDIKLFQTVAKKLTDMSYGIVTDPAIIEQLEKPGIGIYSGKLEKPIWLTEELNDKNLKAFIKKASFPIIGKLGPQTFKKYVERGLPMIDLFILYSDNAHLDIETNALLPLAEDEYYNEKFSFVTVDYGPYGRYGAMMGVQTPPGLIIETGGQEKKEKFLYTGELVMEDIKKFLDDFLEGKLEPYLRTEPVPEDQPGPEYILVGSEFEKIVFDETKDVFVVFYAPWCGHCKALHPKLEEVAVHYKDTPSVIIAKIDGTVNDAKGVSIQGYPTILFYPANGKEKPISYPGARETEDIIKFIDDKSQASREGGKVDL